MSVNIPILNVCRTCEASSNLTLVDSVPYLHQMLKAYLNLNPLPQQEVMCSACIKVIHDFKSFELRSLEVDDKLRQRLDCQITDESGEIVAEAMEEPDEQLSLNDSSGDEEPAYYEYAPSKPEEYVLGCVKGEGEIDPDGELISGDYTEYTTVFDPLNVQQSENQEITEADNPLVTQTESKKKRKKGRPKKQQQHNAPPEFVTVDGTFFCSCCQKNLPKSILGMHLKLHTKSRTFHCDVCDKDILSKYTLAKHKQLECEFAISDAEVSSDDQPRERLPRQCKPATLKM